MLAGGLQKSPVQVLPCEFCKIFDKTFFAEQTRETTFDNSFNMFEMETNLTDTYQIFEILMKTADFFSDTNIQLSLILHLLQT